MAPKSVLPECLRKELPLTTGRSLSLLIALATTFSLVYAAQNPSATINNGQLQATLYLPSPQKGFYRATRFDWSGVVSSLQYKGHNYVTPWYEATDPQVSDFEYRGDQIVTGPGSTIIGFPEEFLLADRTTQGWKEAAVGGTFLKIGVGVLRKPDDKPYDHTRLYPIVDGGKRTIKRKVGSIEFTQTVNDPLSGYGYAYTKRVSLTAGKPQMVIEHTLRNIGSKAIEGEVYDHNFTRWDNETPNPDYSITLAFEPKIQPSAHPMPLAFIGRTATFTRILADRDAIRSSPEGFGPDARDYDFHIENKKLALGLRITADQPLAHFAIWGMRSVFAVEPFLTLDIKPGSSFSWKLIYDAYTLPGDAH